MDERADRGEFYPGGRTTPEGGGGTDTGKVDRVNLGEVGESYTLKDVKKKVNQIVRAIAPAVTCLALCAWAATAPLEDLPNTAPVVTNEEDAVAMAAVGALGQAMSNRVEAAEGALQAEIAGATNAVVQAALRAAVAESNRVDATFAKRSEIPAAPDLAPYALKSELPQDYLTENDITNLATRAWIEAQGYGTGADMDARIDAQNLAIDAATNAVLRDFRLKIDDLRLGTNALAVAHRTDVNALRAADTALSNRLDTATNAVLRDFRLKIDDLRLGTNALWYAMKEGTNRLWAAHAAASNRVNAATNALARAVRAATNELARADARLDAKIDALELTGGMTRLWSSDATTYQDATGTVWQVQDSLGPWQATTSSVQFVSWEDFSTEEYDLWKICFSVDGTNADGYAASPVGLTSYTLSAGVWGYESGDPGEFDVSFVRPTISGGATNAVNRVAYTNDLAAATNGVMGEVDNRFNQWGEMGTVYGARTLVGTSDTVTADAVIEAIGSGGGGGTPEWRVVEIDENTPVSFVTNGIASKLINGELYATTNGWPDGASMFVRGSVELWPSDVGEEIRLVGYGTWPTNDFQSVWWRSGTNIFVNILVEE